MQTTQIGTLTIECVPGQPELMPAQAQCCTRRQGRLALLQAGLLDQVEGILAAIPDHMARRAAQIEYEADTWELTNDMLQAMWGTLGKTPDELATFFNQAAAL